MRTATAVHPSAVVGAGARLAQGVTVGPFVTIEDDVEVLEDTVLLPGTVLLSGARVGRGCRLGPYAVVGGEPMDSRFQGEPSLAVLQDGAVLRDFATVHRATGEGQATVVGSGSLVMSYAHISHNVRVGSGCVITTSVQLGGHCSVGDGAFLGSTSILHQFCRVGAYAMYGAGSAANQDVLPFSMARGNPARHYRANRVGLQRHGITGQRYAAIERALRLLRRRDRAGFETLAQESTDVALLEDFIATSRRGIARFVGG